MMKNIFLTLCLFFSLFVSCGSSSKNNLKKELLNIEEKSEIPLTDEEIILSIEQYYNDIEIYQKKYNQIAIWNKMLGLRLFDNKQYGPALEYFQKALEITPNNPVLYNYIGQCATYLGNACMDIKAVENLEKRINYYYLAEDAYLRAVSIDSNYVDALLGLSILYSYQMEDSKSAIPYLEKILLQNKKNIDAMFILARCYYYTKNYDLSLLYYDKILEISKDESEKKTAEENKTIVLEKAYEEE